MTTWPKQSECDVFYGNPRSQVDPSEASFKWIAENIVIATPPWKLITAWDFKTVHGVRVHRKCYDSLLRVFNLIWNASGKSQMKIDEWGMNLYAGGFNFRLMKGGNRLSMHSWGCAVDFDSARNGFGDLTPNFAKVPAVLEAFENEGWTWGGNWRKPDGMHWQAARV